MTEEITQIVISCLTFILGYYLADYLRNRKLPKRTKGKDLDTLASAFYGIRKKWWIFKEPDFMFRKRVINSIRSK